MLAARSAVMRRRRAWDVDSVAEGVFRRTLPVDDEKPRSPRIACPSKPSSDWRKRFSILRAAVLPSDEGFFGHEALPHLRALFLTGDVLPKACRPSCCASCFISERFPRLPSAPAAGAPSVRCGASFVFPAPGNASLLRFARVSASALVSGAECLPPRFSCRCPVPCARMQARHGRHGRREHSVAAVCPPGAGLDSHSGRRAVWASLRLQNFHSSPHSLCLGIFRVCGSACGSRRERRRSALRALRMPSALPNFPPRSAFSKRSSGFFSEITAGPEPVLSEPELRPRLFCFFCEVCR